MLKAGCLPVAAALLLACSDAAHDPTQRDEPDAAPVRDVDSGADAARPGRSDARTDARTDASTDAGALPVADADVPMPLRFESVEQTLDDGEVVIEKVSYRSQGLLVWGQVCRPHPLGTLGAGPFPVHIINHGGFSGLSDWNGGDCASTAKRGFIAAESSYRGEDGSEGQVEVCLGEVDDVLQLTDIVRAQPYAVAERVLMSGLSHGGCITLRALARGAPVKLAVDIFGPTDWARAHAGWKQALAAGSAQAAAYQGLISALEQATGGTPEQVPEAYKRRSPVQFSAELDAIRVPLLRVQGTADLYVPTTQACALADVSQGFERYHVNVFGTVSASAPEGCTASWQAGPRPTTSWPRDRYLMVYDGVGHNFEGFATSYLIADMTAFLTARFP